MCSSAPLVIQLCLFHLSTGAAICSQRWSVSSALYTWLWGRCDQKTHLAKSVVSKFMRASVATSHHQCLSLLRQHWQNAEATLCVFYENLHCWLECFLCISLKCHDFTLWMLLASVKIIFFYNWLLYLGCCRCLDYQSMGFVFFYTSMLGVF